MNGTTLARVAAIAFVAFAITVAVLTLREGRRPAPVITVPPVVGEQDDADPMQAELRRCQVLGEAATRDPGCLAVWAESRRRFLTGETERR
jgi:conjugative transfer region protein TrbK